MRILYVVHQYDYGKPEQGYCFEHYNFYLSLVGMGHEVLYFDFPTIAAEHGERLGDERAGVAAMNRQLRETVDREQPDLMFTVVWGDDLLDAEVVRAISEQTPTTTVNWYCDDHWRFESLSRQWTPCFNYVVTTSQTALAQYDAAGFTNVIKSQWGCNPQVYRPVESETTLDVSFVGLPHGRRREVIQKITQAGIDIQAFGKGWDHGRVSQDEMVELFGNSKISLNFAEASTGAKSSRLMKQTQQLAGKLPGGWRLQKMIRESQLRTLPAQIKGRVFEVPACGGLLLTGNAENLNDYFVFDEEIAVFESDDELIDKIQYYLENQSERLAVAEAGYERAMRDHTYASRFEAIFQAIGLAGHEQRRAA